MLSERFLQIENNRASGKVKYSLHDFFMAGFAMMYLQDSSLLSFQTRLQTAFNLNNLKTMFHLDSIPKDTQLRDVLDQAPQMGLKPFFQTI
jgi:hypothetical protein